MALDCSPRTNALIAIIDFYLVFTSLKVGRVRLYTSATCILFLHVHAYVLENVHGLHKHNFDNFVSLKALLDDQLFF